ncbi:MAG: formylglycine-generating enzyme family protein [Desulfobacterales bacterium]
MSEVVTNTIGIELVPLPAGSFTLGGDPVAEQADENERPRHLVTFHSNFSMGKYPVTQAQWQMLMASNPSHFQDADRPVEMVSHSDALRFIERLNQKESTQAYRLPTEAQWEYAARAGSRSTYCFGPERMKLGQYAWYRNNSEAGTHPVGQLLPNGWNLYDMHGNVHEWCLDWFDRNYYARSPEVDPQGPARGLARSLRGGDWGSADWYCRCASRSLSSADRRSPRVGFRVVKV